MRKLNMHTENLVDENIRRIGELFPNALTERKNDRGETEQAIDFDVLRQELSKDIVEGREERYQFTWPDKKKSILLANAPVSDSLRPCRVESVDFDTTKNLYIEGDNLNVLKLLQETYLGKVKMIYIDPPYNTGNDSFVYNDDFDMESDEFADVSGQYDEYSNVLFDMKHNSESNGRFHTDWLNMIYPRVKLAKDFLTNDGLMFISIDDNEIGGLRLLCDEIFGSSSFVGTFKWNRTAKAPSLSNSIRVKYEYVLCYCKEGSVQLYGKKSYNTEAPLLHLPNKQAEILFPENSIRIPYSFTKGHYSEKYQVQLLDDMILLNGMNQNAIKLRGCFAWSQTKINAYLEMGNTFLVKKDLATIYYNMDPTNSFIPPSDIISDEECGVKRNTDAKEELRKLGIEFDYAKPVSLVQYLTDIAVHFEKDSIILDFFSGSATTAHAVMQLNAEDGGKRKFIMVQLPETTDEKSEAYKAGYKNVCEIGKERIRRAGAKIKQEIEQGNRQVRLDEDPKQVPDIGFRVLKLDSSNMKDVYYSPEEYAQLDLSSLADNIKESRTPEDLLFQVMLELGVLLSSPIEESTIAGKQVFRVADNFLIACFDKDITNETVTAIAKLKPYYAVFRDNSYANDAVAVNFEQIFAAYSPDTVRRVL